MENLVELIQQQLCQNHSRKQIKDVLYMVKVLKPLEPPEQLVDLVVDIMLNDETPFSYNSSPSITPDCTQEALWENELEGAVGFGRSNIFSSSASELLMKTFPDADVDFVLEYCEREGNHFDLDKAVDTFSTEGYLQAIDVQSTCNRFQGALPFATKLVGQASINNSLENNGLTSPQNFLTKMNEDPTDFRLEQFLERFPDPERFFGDPNKENPLGFPEVSQEDIDYALTFLYNRYRKIRKRHIGQVFERMQKRLYDCCLYLDKFPVEMRRERKMESSRGSENADLLLEVTYLKHRRFLRCHLKYKNRSYEKRLA